MRPKIRYVVYKEGSGYFTDVGYDRDLSLNINNASLYNDAYLDTESDEKILVVSVYYIGHNALVFENHEI